MDKVDSWRNKLFFGDNLEIMKMLEDSSIDLIYLDPPFQSGRDYNLVFKELGLEVVSAQVKAFTDTWQWNEESERTYNELIQKQDVAVEVKDYLIGMKKVINNSAMMAYLVMMAPRLIEMRRLLKDSGSIYLHCDPRTSHYLKILMDMIFGKNQFRNEIVWGYRTGGVSNRYWASKHDIILFYTKTDNYKFNALKERIYYEKPFFSPKQDEQGRYYADVYIRDVWDDIKPVINVSKERIGYPTQKPEALLQRIIMASSDEGDLVLDPFCGCGTTVAVAHKLNRRWIGIDIAYIAIDIISRRLGEAEFEIDGIPKDLQGAYALKNKDPFRFQEWAVVRLGGVVSSRRSGDEGVDGKIYFYKNVKSKNSVSYGEVVIQVKGGKVGVKDVRELIGTIKGQRADFGILVSFDKPTQQMKKTAIGAGLYADNMPRIQFVTVREIIDGNIRLRIPNPVRLDVDVILRQGRLLEV